ncbi:helix-turn-helix domain-containing protein [Aldersonia kunmingensis]|uniref:helix-turn-helix domain-containing protein n=1 Tax=Aldersonia kunmingensis TaxID=408066 RepID=UPI00082BBDC8|nr:helix-turn-helix domain-containing protein [Aldersonia kunmingensis]
MSWYTPTPAPADLAEQVVCGWTAAVSGTQRLVPDGCLDVLYIAGVGIRVCGPETAPWTFTLPPDTEAVGIRFRPGSAAALLHTSLAELRNRRVAFEDLFGSASERVVLGRLDDTTDQRARLDVLEDLARELRDDGTDTDPLAGHIGSALLRSSWSVGDLADAASLTERQLQRRCNDAFGYGPAMLRSILRLQRFMARARQYPSTPLAGLAWECGFADQSHLSRECRRFADQTPTELLAGEAPDWHGGAPLFATRSDVRNIQATSSDSSEESAA